MTRGQVWGQLSNAQKNPTTKNYQAQNINRAIVEKLKPDV